MTMADWQSLCLKEKEYAVKAIEEYCAALSEVERESTSLDERLLDSHIFERLAAIINSEKSARELMAPVYGRDRYFFRTCPAPPGALTKEQLKEVGDFWAPYSFAYKNNPETQRYFTLMSGRFDPSYVSFGLHYLYLRKFWSTPKVAFMTDKNNYDILFPDVKMPETVFHRIGGRYYDGRRNIITENEALERCLCYVGEGDGEVILKPAGWGEGHGIKFMRGKNREENTKIFRTLPKVDYICQRVIVNHESWRYSSCKGFNVARINTMNFDGVPKIMASYLKTAVKDSDIVNMATGAWGILINEDGTLGDRAVETHAGRWNYEFPNGEKFAGRRLFNYERVKETVLMMAQRVSELRAIAWDVAVDIEGDVVLIELNGCGGTEEYQAHGVHPYGSREKMKEILDEYLIKKFYYERADWEWDYWEFKDSITISKYAGLKKNVVVPERLRGKKVTAIRGRAFSGKGLEKLVIPESVSLMDKDALADCGNECDVNMPARLRKK